MSTAAWFLVVGALLLLVIRKPGDDDRLRFALTGEAGLNNGTAADATAVVLTSVVLVAVTLSIVAHGISVTPIMRLYGRRLAEPTAADSGGPSSRE